MSEDASTPSPFSPPTRRPPTCLYPGVRLRMAEAGTSGHSETCSDSQDFGVVTLPRLAPGGSSALRHAHTKQDEFVYILEGRPTLVTGAGRTALKPGMCAGFKAGSGDAHCLVNEAGEVVVYLEIGDRAAGDAVTYPDDDLAVVTVDGQRRMAHKDGTPY